MKPTRIQARSGIVDKPLPNLWDRCLADRPRRQDASLGLRRCCGRATAEVLRGTVAVLLLVCGLGPVRAAEKKTPLPPKEYVEQHVFDEQSGQWVRTPDPVPGTEDGDLDIARQWMAREDYKTASKILDAWIKTYGPDSPRYPEALYLKGSAYLERGWYGIAQDCYKELLDNYPGSEYAEKALWGRYRVAEQFLAGERRHIWGGLFWIRDYEAGLETMDDFVLNYADTPLAELGQMAKADYYFAQGEFELAEDSYATFAQEYPKSRWQPRALLRSAESALASFPGIKFDDASLVEAKERFEHFAKLYPAAAEEQGVSVILEGIDATRADKTYDIAQFYERTKHPNAARFYYRSILRKWPDTPAAARARGRLAALGEPEVASPVAVSPPPNEGVAR